MANKTLTPKNWRQKQTEVEEEKKRKSPMALQLKSPLAAAALSALALLAAALLAATVALGVGGARLSGEVARLREELEGARKRVSDLEAENDYLFEEREDGAAAKVGGVYGVLEGSC